MRVLIVSREYPPAPGGGIRTYVISVARAMAERGAQVSVLTELVPGAKVFERSPEGVEIHRVPAFEWADGRAVGLPRENLRLLPESRSLASKIDGEAAWALRVAHKIRELHARTPFDIIEAQEYDAPLYYFLQLRLAEPDFPQIPVVTHMHSPTELNKRYDEDAPWTRLNAYRRMMEKFQAAAADGICAPSENLARWTENWLGADAGSVELIRLPLLHLEKITAEPIDTPPDPASPEFFTVGRVELRKGSEVLARALARLAPDWPGLRVHLIGGDTEHLPMGVPLVEWLRRRVLVHGGEAAQAAFHHLGPRPLGDLWRGDEVRRSIAFLIPSLWDNSPYTCIEAMAHGKPVIATDNGGQGEMVQHGRSGLVVPAGDADALAEAMRSLWSMTPERRAEMGLEARRRILEVCGTGRVVGERLAFYEKVIQKFHAAGGRARVPHLLPHDDQPMRLGHPKAARKPASRPGKISVVVPCFNLGEYVGETIESLVSSRRKPDEVVVVDDGSTDARTIEVLREWEGRRLPFSFRLLRTRNQGLATARRTGAEACSGEYLVFLDADDRVAPEYLGLCAGILDRHPEAGVATAWYEYFGQCDGGHWTPLAAQFPLFLMENCVGAGAMLRREAYDEAGGPKPAMRHNFEDWELWVAVAEKGWAVVTIPRPLFQYRVRNGSMYREMTPVQFNLLRGLMFEFHPELVRRHALACAQMAESGTGVAVDFSGRTDHRFEFERLREEVFVLREMVGRAKAISRNPLLVLPWLWKKLWKKSGGAA